MVDVITTAPRPYTVIPVHATKDTPFYLMAIIALVNPFKCPSLYFWEQND